MEFLLLTLRYCFYVVKLFVLMMMMIMMMMDEVEVEEVDDLWQKIFSVDELELRLEVCLISIVRSYSD